MLVLTRKEGESLYIDNIMITVVGIENDKVRIGIDAPRSMHIFRKELLTETSAENRNAAGSFFGGKTEIGAATSAQMQPILSAIKKQDKSRNKATDAAAEKAD